MQKEPIETTQVDGKIYEIEKLRDFAERLAVHELPLNDVREAVGPGHIYWIDRNGEALAPHQIIRDWGAAQHNDAWKDHVDSIMQADLSKPIWMMKDGHVFDGVHRLIRAVIEDRPTIKVRIFEELSETALYTPPQNP